MPDSVTGSGSAGLEARVRRLEDHEELHQLVWRYSLALDARDVHGLARMFVPDVEVGDGTRGHDALAAFFDHVMRSMGITFHLVGNHIIDFDDDDHARGVVYCRPEHEVDGEWIVMPMQYHDRYLRTSEGWRFASRSPRAFYAADVLQRPQSVPGRFHFPGNRLITSARLPEQWDTWNTFRDTAPEDAASEPE